ncbi:hypothetical protein HU200_039444 [Digitaria exilis]|uniref:Uncharacterized protein n=1 Tax=Digitaria exilis TaxID=1010633 RepID=A0A835EIA8_9POAL|nr:hypothetical protein HU200_039444 [Digitaria exilis]
MMLPLLSMDDPNVTHFVLYDWADKVGKFSLVTIDLSTKRVVGSVVPYINGEEDLYTDDADMVKAKPYFFMHFLPMEFPTFLNLHCSKEEEEHCVRHFHCIGNRSNHYCRKRKNSAFVAFTALAISSLSFNSAGFSDGLFQFKMDEIAFEV